MIVKDSLLYVLLAAEVARTIFSRRGLRLGGFLCRHCQYRGAAIQQVSRIPSGHHDAGLADEAYLESI